MASFRQACTEAFDRANRSQYYLDNYHGLTAFERHTKLVNQLLSYGGSKLDGAAQQQPSTRTDKDMLQQTYRFVRTEEDDADDSWEVRLARKYYSRLFKEYCIADLSRYKESCIGLRWRSQAEVISGKGQFVCGAKVCDNKEGLCSYEVNFEYMEVGEEKQALVKLRVCPACAYKLNYRKEKQFRKALQKRRAADEADGAAGAAAAVPSPGAQEQQRAGKRSRAREEGGAAADEPDAAGEGAAYGIKPPPGRPAEEQQQTEQPAQAAVLPADESMWERKPTLEVPSLEDELDQYLDGMFM